MRWLSRGAPAGALALLLAAAPARPATQYPDAGPGAANGQAIGSIVINALNAANQALPIGPANPLPISAYAPSAYAAPLAVSTASALVALPAGATVVVYNPGSSAAYVTLGNASVVATTSDDVVQPGSWISFAVGSNSYLAAITASSTTTLNISGGAGLPAGGGGGSSGGGSGTVTSVGFTGGLISVGTPTTTPALTVAGVSGGVPYFSSTSAWASSGLLAANALMVGGGAGAAPSTVTTGANVLTALGNAINAASGLPNVDGAITTGDCLEWGPGVQDAGAACGGSTLTVGTTTTSGGAAGQIMYDTGSVLQETTHLTYASGLLTSNLGTLNTTITDAHLLTNTVAATSSQNQISPALDFIGQGWKTTATAGSQKTEFQVYVNPRTGASNPTAQLLFIPTVNTIVNNGLAFASSETTNAPASGTFLTGLDGGGTYGVDTSSWTGIGPVGAASAFGFYLNGTNYFSFSAGSPPRLTAGSAAQIGFISTASGNATPDTMWTRQAAATMHQGAADAAAPVAQTLGVQSVVAGTSNTAGALWTFEDSIGTGTGASGGYAWQTHPAGGSGSAQNSAVTQMTLSSAGLLALASISSDSGHTTATLCEDTTTHAVYSGSNTTGACAGSGALASIIGSSGSLSGSWGYGVCTTTCSVTLPAPTTNSQFCVRNDSNVTTVITIAAISGVQFEKTTYAGYGTVTTGTMVSGGALGDKICLVGRDATHYLVGSFVGTWTNS